MKNTMNSKLAKEIIRSMFPTATLHFGGPGNLFAKYAQVGDKVRSKKKSLIGTGDTWQQVVNTVTKVYTRRQTLAAANAITKSVSEVRATFLLTQ